MTCSTCSGPVRAGGSESAAPRSACSRRRQDGFAYPDASFVLCRSRGWGSKNGTVTGVTERQQQAEQMLDSLYDSEVAEQKADESQEDARRMQTLTTTKASATA